MNKYRTHTCGDLDLKNVDEEVKLSGFVRTIRDLGSVIFVDLRDHYGVTQLVITGEENIVKFNQLVTIESTICITGRVIKRNEDNVNAKISTGKIEVGVQSIELLSRAKNNLPFEVQDSREVREDLRLEYRFLDLRNEILHDKIIFRAKVLKTLREKMDALGFLEIQTPILTSSSPEGARDYLVPSRIHPGEFYALPQAPQQYKQLLMISGFDKYYQIAPCFRDEDPRADRSPGEFYQLDFEMSFAEQEDIFRILENVVGSTFKELTTKAVSEAPFIRIPYNEAMNKYGSDKPDLRNPLVIEDATSIFKDTEFKVFQNKVVKVIKAPCSEVTRKFFDEMVDYATTEAGLKGLAWVKINEDSSVSGVISKFVTENVLNELVSLTDAKPGDGLFFIANDKDKVCKEAGSIRIELGKRLNLIEKNIYKFCFIVDFPMYELDDNGKVEFSHNPFSMPQGGLDSLNNMNPLDILAYQYDLVCNGYELASGAVRNHNIETMVRAFEIAGYTRDHVESKFGALFNAFQYGAPPHAGAAPGIDRMIMLLSDEVNIREVIAFPKNSRARDLLMQAPSKVTEQQLRDVHIKLREENKK
ncbi:MAG: aspartate--tRNA ligase [Clostridia bacterium]|nr:aspartate--tRNA ligase [Clostridia bacterium]